MTTEQQAKYWRYAAWTSPFVALAILVGEILIGFDSLINITSVTIVTIFVAISVFWWWWAISKIVHMMNVAETAAQNFDELKNELKELKQDVGNRQWREPSND